MEADQAAAIKLEPTYWADRTRRVRSPEELIILHIAIKALCDILRKPPKMLQKPTAKQKKDMAARNAASRCRERRRDFESAWWWIFTEDRRFLSFRTVCEAFGINADEGRLRILRIRNEHGITEKRSRETRIVTEFVDILTSKTQNLGSEESGIQNSGRKEGQENGPHKE